MPPHSRHCEVAAPRRVVVPVHRPAMKRAGERASEEETRRRVQPTNVRSASRVGRSTVRRLGDALRTYSRTRRQALLAEKKEIVGMQLDGTVR